MSTVSEFPCDLCGEIQTVEVPYSKLYTLNNDSIHICVNCGFVYVKYRRSAEEIARTWSEDIYGKGYTARIPLVKARQMYVADFIDVNVNLKDKFLVDIGAGEGQFLEIARDEYGANVFGIEPSLTNCNNLHSNGFDCFHGTIEKYAADGNIKHADIVTIMWTLENCMSCTGMMKTAYSVVKESGYVAVATGSRLLVPFKKPLHYYLGKFSQLDTHSFRFSANTLQGLLAVSGFKPVFINRYIDTDWLVAIGQKQPEGTKIDWKGDDYIKVADFFERWHHETIHYR